MRIFIKLVLSLNTFQVVFLTKGDFSHSTLYTSKCQKKSNISILFLILIFRFMHHDICSYSQSQGFAKMQPLQNELNNNQFNFPPIHMFGTSMQDKNSKSFLNDQEFKDYHICCNCHFTENSVKWQLQHKNRYFFKIVEILYSVK